MTKCGDDIRVVYPLFQAESGGSTPTSPLQLRIGHIDRETFIQLNRKWHSRVPETGNCFDGICYGAEYDGMFYAVAWWSKPVSPSVMDGETWELRRMAVASDAPKNTPSRFLKIMVMMIKKDRPELKKLVSYQDPVVHTGTIYKASGWINEGSRKSGGFGSAKVRYRKPDQAPGDKIRWALFI